MDDQIVAPLGIVFLMWFIWFTVKMSDINTNTRIAAKQAVIQTNILARLANVDPAAMKPEPKPQNKLSKFLFGSNS